MADNGIAAQAAVAEAPAGAEAPAATGRFSSACLGLGVALLGYFMITGGTGLGEKISLFAGVASAVVAVVPSLTASAGRGVRPLRARDVALAGFPVLVVALAGNAIFQAALDRDVGFGDTTGLTEGVEVLVEVVPGDAGELSGVVVFRPQLTPATEQRNFSDCVVPAVLTFTPLVDDLNTGIWKVRYGDTVSIPITGSAKKMRLRIGVEVPGDDVCTVRLELKDGKLDRRIL